MAKSSSANILDTPSQDWDAPEFCGADVRQLAHWVDQLPRTNLGQTSRSLYNALKELNRSRINPALRFELIEILRPVLYNTCRALQKHFYNQPIVLPPQGFQVFRLAQAMQFQLATAYQVVAREALPHKSLFPLNKPKGLELAAQAVHRALTEYHELNFRASLIYTESDKGLWRKMHTLYRFALEHELTGIEVHDPETTGIHPITVEQSYLRALLLGCVRTNQLRQLDLLWVREHINDWLPLARLERYRVAEDDIIAVNMASDDPPVYNVLFTPPRDNTLCCLMRTDALLDHLRGLLKSNKKTVSNDLLKHLIVSWGSYTKRAYMRMDTRDNLALCIGLSHLHFFAADGVEFEDFVSGNVVKVLDDDPTTDNPFLKDTRGMKHEAPDLWNTTSRPDVKQTSVSMESIDSQIREHQHNQAQAKTSLDHDYQIQMINVSPGGYCLQWPADVHARLSNGDVVGIREASHSNWSMGVVRWLRRGGEKITQLGIKLVSPSVIPYGAQFVNQVDAPDEFHRVLMLPEIKLIGQAASLITPKIPFRQGHKVLLVQQGRQMTVLLTRLVSATGAFNQFEFEVIEKSLQELIESSDGDQDFDSLWDSL